MNTIIHEIAHQGNMEHGVAHNNEMLVTGQHFDDTGLTDYFRDALLDVLVRHESTFTAMREAYGRSTTKNTAKSLEDYGKSSTSTSARSDTDGASDPLRTVQAGGRQGGDGANEAGSGRGDESNQRGSAGADASVESKLIPLCELSDPMAAGRQEGKTLYATVPGTDMPSRDADASTGQYQRAMPEKNLGKFNKKILPAWMSSKFLFDSYGGWWGNTMKAIDEKRLSRLSAYIQETSPNLTTVIKWVNNNYGLQGAVADLMLRAKDDRRGGSIQVEVLADHLASLSAEMTRKVLASLDGRPEALRKGEILPPIEGIDRKSGIDLLASDMLDRWWEYARTTRDERLRARMAGVYNPKTKQWEGGVKFSQGMIIPDNLKNIVSPTFGE